MRDLVIVGCGGFGREVHDVVDAINAAAPTWNLLGYADDSPEAANVRLVERRGSTMLGTTSDVLDAGPPASFAVGIGNGAVRKKLEAQWVQSGWEPATLIHPTATVGADSSLGRGCVLCAGARVSNNVTLGSSVHLNPNVTVGHDVVLHDFVSVNPLVAISGWVEAREGVMFGTHSTILQNLTVGEYALIGAGACVVKDVLAGTTVKGVPAR